MNYRIYIIIFSFFLLFSCETTTDKSSTKINSKSEVRYKNLGFALIYNDNIEEIKKIDERFLDIYHKSLKRKSIIKITNPENDKYVIARVKSNRVRFSNFYNSILSPRIAEELDLKLKEPYVEITLISKDSMFVAKKAKMFDEEKSVAEKAPVDGIQINDLNLVKPKKKEVLNKQFSYSIKVADFYFKDTAQNMSKRIRNELSINNLSVIKISKTKFRVLIGPFSDIKTLKDSFEKMNSLNFENLEILKNV